VIRVCHLGKFYPPASGGIETHVQALARVQAELGLSVSVLCINHLDDRGEDVTFERFARTSTAVEADGPVQVKRIGRVASLSRLDVAPAVLSALREQSRRGVDVLHLHSPNPTMLLALEALRPSVPLLITHHSDVVRQKLLGRAFRVFERRVYRRARFILPTSPRYQEGSPILQELAATVRPLPMGIDLRPFLQPSAAARAEAEQLRRRFGAPLWVSVGRLVYYKGLEVGLEALQVAPGHLLVIGTGPEYPALRQRARALGVESRVTFAGRASEDELVGAYLAATALWFPSVARSEGFGLAQVEAMASGCPVINTLLPGSGVAWVSPHEVTGLSVPVGDARALAAAARRLADDAALRERLAAAAVDRARAEFDHQVMGRRCVALYEEALGR
jgi:rhamnosyl/mannosyltransferase